MYQYIKAPAELGDVLQIDEVLVEKEGRVRAGQVLMYLSLANGDRLPIMASHKGFVVFVRNRGARVQANEILLIVDVSEYTEYRVDSIEVNPMTELGEDSRRATERAGARKHATSFAADLIEPKEVNHGNSPGFESLLKDHPKLKSKGEPPKMSGRATDNALAQEKFEQNIQDPEYQKQLSLQLQQVAEQRLAHSVTPTLNR